MLSFALVFAEKGHTIFICLDVLPEALNYLNFCGVLLRILNKLRPTANVILSPKYSDSSFVVLWSFTVCSLSVLAHSYG